MTTIVKISMTTVRSIQDFRQLSPGDFTKTVALLFACIYIIM